MLQENLISFFKNTNLFSAAAAVEIAAHFTRKDIFKNQLQLTAGKICDEYLFLEKGYMRVLTMSGFWQQIQKYFSMRL